MNDTTVRVAPPKRSKTPIIIIISIALLIVVVAVAFLLGRTSAVPTNPVPVTVTFRQAIMGTGYVLQIHNKSNKSLPLKITVTNPTFNKTKTFDAVANPGTLPLEIGHLEGWTFASGDVIEVVSDGYGPINGKVP